MTPIEEHIYKLYGFEVKSETLEKFLLWKKLFCEYNSHTNLMSKNDVKVLEEKHVLDSLAITLFKEFKSGITLLDVGAGGGFPSLILAIFFPEIKVIALDSVSKKTNFLTLAKKELSLENFSVINERAEKAKPLNADFITNRAVGTIADVWKNSSRHLVQGGFFVSYKALNAEEEAKEAEKKSNLTKPVFIEYGLPLSENYVRKLVIFKKSVSKSN